MNKIRCYVESLLAEFLCVKCEWPSNKSCFDRQRHFGIPRIGDHLIRVGWWWRVHDNNTAIRRQKLATFFKERILKILFRNSSGGENEQRHGNISNASSHFDVTKAMKKMQVQISSSQHIRFDLIFIVIKKQYSLVDNTTAALANEN